MEKAKLLREESPGWRAMRTLPYSTGYGVNNVTGYYILNVNIQVSFKVLNFLRNRKLPSVIQSFRRKRKSMEVDVFKLEHTAMNRWDTGRGGDYEHPTTAF